MTFWTTLPPTEERIGVPGGKMWSDLACDTAKYGGVFPSSNS